MESLNLLEYSTYDVESIKNNRVFFSHLLKEITDTYKVYDKKEFEEKNTKRVEFSPASTRTKNVFMSMNVNGEIKIVFSIGYLGEKGKDLFKKKEMYKIDNFSFGDMITMEGIVFANYKEHLKNIVTCIELCDYSFK